MYTRVLEAPSRSFFLFGPRATGKSTWLGQHFAAARSFDLLDSALRLRLLRDAAAFAMMVQAEPRGSWIVVDEIQLVPTLLGECHRLMEKGGYRFAMTGSSTRKLRRGGGNLLAGRASLRHLYPLTGQEIDGEVEIAERIELGCLPQVVTAEDRGTKLDILEAYALTYLREEIQAEALVRDLGAFARFLEVAALANAQVTNVSAIARDAGVQRPTVQGYFEVLTDTLVATLLPAWRPRARIKEQAHPKFYWFDSGVARAMSGRLRTPCEREERGHLFETYVLHELRAHNDYARLGGALSYWRTASGVEVDFVWSRGKENVAIEVKSSPVWKREYGAGLAALAEAAPLTACYGVYGGKERLVDGKLKVLPVTEFLDRLYAGKILD